MSESNVQMELPRYDCHKQVWALQIDKMDGNIMHPVDKRYSAIPFSDEYMIKHAPHAGGYYVVYKDGYISFSPKEVFEEGYTLIE